MGVGGAIDDQYKQVQVKMQQQELNSKVKFQDAQSANLAAETLIKDKQLHQMDQQEQDRHTASSLETVEHLNTLGIQPTLVTANNSGGAEATAGLQQPDVQLACDSLTTPGLGLSAAKRTVSSAWIVK
jgi:hypothetical protein